MNDATLDPLLWLMLEAGERCGRGAVLARVIPW